MLVGLFPMQAVTKQFLFWSDWQNCGEAGVVESEIPQDWKMYDAGARSWRFIFHSNVATLC